MESKQKLGIPLGNSLKLILLTNSYSSNLNFDSSYFLTKYEIISLSVKYLFKK